MAKKIIRGRVVSSKGDKSIVVLVDYSRQDQRFKKTVRQSKRIMAHDAQNEAKEGDWVTLKEGRPFSKKKRFALESIVQKAMAE